MGHLFVGDAPLDESPMKDHPLTPMRDSSLLRLLEPQVTAPVGLIGWPTVLLSVRVELGVPEIVSRTREFEAQLGVVR